MGSFDFTNSAENLLLIHDRALAERYEQNWQKHKAHSEPYQDSENGGFRILAQLLSPGLHQDTRVALES